MLMVTLSLGARRAGDRLQRFVSDDSGIAVTEYGLLIALVAILLIGVVTLFGSQISSWFQAKTSQITSI